MARMFVDCREYPSEMNCTVAISADTKEELVDAAVQHAVAVHGHHDSPQLRQLAKMSKPRRATVTYSWANVSTGPSFRANSPASQATQPS